MDIALLQRLTLSLPTVLHDPADLLLAHDLERRNLICATFEAGTDSTPPSAFVIAVTAEGHALIAIRRVRDRREALAAVAAAMQLESRAMGLQEAALPK